MGDTVKSLVVEGVYLTALSVIRTCPGVLRAWNRASGRAVEDDTRGSRRTSVAFRSTQGFQCIIPSIRSTCEAADGSRQCVHDVGSGMLRTRHEMQHVQAGGRRKLRGARL